MSAILRVEEHRAPPENPAGARLLAIITGLLLSGRRVSHDDAAFHRAHLDWEFRSRQWVLLTFDDGRFMGWLAWYRVGGEALAALRKGDFAALLELGPADQTLTAGPNLYFATAAIVPDAPSDCFHRLCQMAARLNPDVKTVSWHSRQSDGSSIFTQASGNHALNGILSEE